MLISGGGHESVWAAILYNGDERDRLYSLSSRDVYLSLMGIELFSLEVCAHWALDLDRCSRCVFCDDPEATQRRRVQSRLPHSIQLIRKEILYEIENYRISKKLRRIQHPLGNEHRLYQRERHRYMWYITDEGQP